MGKSVCVSHALNKHEDFPCVTRRPREKFEAADDMLDKLKSDMEIEMVKGRPLQRGSDNRAESGADDAGHEHRCSAPENDAGNRPGFPCTTGFGGKGT